MSVPSGASTSLSPGGLGDRSWRIVLGLLAAVHLGLGAHCAWRASVTHDEYWHLPAGVAVWRLGRFDVDDLNPPLSRAWSALPVVLLGGVLGEPAEPNDAFALGDHFLAANRDRYRELFFVARVANLVWSLLTGAAIALWGRQLFGPWAGLVGAALWFLCPIALSNAALATPDACAAFFFVAVPFAFWRFAQVPSWPRCLAAGALLGLAQLAKFTDVLLLPISLLVWWVAPVQAAVHAAVQSGIQTDRSPGAWRRAAGQWIAALSLALVVWNAGYLFGGTGRPLKSYEFLSRSLQGLSGRLSAMGAVPVPLPGDYLRGFDRQRSIMEGAHPVFLDGEWNFDGTGFRDYYVRALAYKWPHATQALVLTAVVASLVTRAGRRQWRAHLLLLAPALFVIAIASASGMQLGVRYILPAFPLIYLFAGQLGTWWNPPRRSLRTAWLAICLAMLPLGLSRHPHELAYFNELAGGPIGGREHLLDSNLDWGQGLFELREFLRREEIELAGLAYFGMVPPAELGIDFRIPPSYEQVLARRELTPGWYAVSVNFVQGRPHTIRDAEGRIRSAGGGEFSYFRNMQRAGNLGGSIDLYHVPAPAGDRPEE